MIKLIITHDEDISVKNLVDLLRVIYRLGGEVELAPSEIKICECGDHITGDYAFVNGKYLCPICMER